MLASLSKLQHHNRFHQILAEYQLLPTATLGFAAFFIAALEGITALALLIPTIREIAAIVGVALLLLYAIAMGINIQHGRTHLDCGCHLSTLSSSNHEKTMISKALVIRNIVIAIALAFACFPSTQRLLNFTDFTLIAFGVCLLSVFYATLNQLITNHYRYQEML